MISKRELKTILSNTAFTFTVMLIVTIVVSMPFWFVYFVSLAWHMGAQ